MNGSQPGYSQAGRMPASDANPASPRKGKPAPKK